MIDTTCFPDSLGPTPPLIAFANVLLSSTRWRSSLTTVSSLSPGFPLGIPLSSRRLPCTLPCYQALAGLIRAMYWLLLAPASATHTRAHNVVLRRPSRATATVRNPEMNVILASFNTQSRLSSRRNRDLESCVSDGSSQISISRRSEVQTRLTYIRVSLASALWQGGKQSSTRPLSRFYYETTLASALNSAPTRVALLPFPSRIKRYERLQRGPK